MTSQSNIRPTTNSILGILPKQRIVAIGREFGVAIPPLVKKEDQIKLLQDVEALDFTTLLGWMGRDELKAACRSYGLDDSGRARSALAGRLIKAHGKSKKYIPSAFLEPDTTDPFMPGKGDIVSVRHRQWLVEDVSLPAEPGQMTKVEMVCLDDDNQGRPLTVMWELELGAKVLQPKADGLGTIEQIDPPRYFAAYLHALKWNSVTASDAKLFQSPFRAGIKLMHHQLTPLKKALELPRSNLFIADDVGLGKTIEAGLILQELLLRQRVDFSLVVCPASVALQWRDEMQKRFGLHFELYNRRFVAKRRRERGFGVNPWSTHNRFVITYQTLRRPEYRDPLLQHIGEKIKKSLLILDEAHTVAPASASKYAIDSRITQVIRDVAPRFENRLFLSATPHNGHSNSFSALLEILDPQRFTRGVPIKSLKQLSPVMVRRLKEDLRELGVEKFPERKVIQIDLRSEAGKWQARFDNQQLEDIGPGSETELVLAEMLYSYRKLMEPKKGRGKLVFINLQKRLLSSIEAFARTLKVHAKSVGKGTTKYQLDLSGLSEDDEYGQDDDTQENNLDAEVSAQSESIPSPEGKAKALLEDMLQLAEQHRGAPDAKLKGLVRWIQHNQCASVHLAKQKPLQAKSAWTDRRVIIFTEYADTKRYLWQVLSTAVENTDRGQERIMHFHGGMSDDQREEVQRAFNSKPEDHPVRILIATDAAREGVNLQGHCADLFHYDVPWNPARMEQRNGRIDRTLQPQPEVRCHYFFYPQRKEDLVLKKLVEKVNIIQKELGSLGTVVMDRYADVLETKGIRDNTEKALAEAECVDDKHQIVKRELESGRDDKNELKLEIDESGSILNNSEKIMAFNPMLLKDAINVGFELAGAKQLKATKNIKDLDAFTLPELPDSWTQTLDILRPPRARDEEFWSWRGKSPQPVVFKPPEKINAGVVHLHLQHPLVQRVLSRFRAQGFSAHDLNRVTIVPNPKDALVRVIAFGRLSLFGPGAVRLHDEVISVAAQWLESKGPKHLKPFADEADRKAIDMLEELLNRSPDLKASKTIQNRLKDSAPNDFSTLWPHIEDEAEAKAHELAQKLSGRANEESSALREILETQSKAIEEIIQGQLQQELPFGDTKIEQLQKRQYEDDRKHMQQRLLAIEKEIETEPASIHALYQVVLKKLEPVGLVYLWPETRA
jgi:SNF2 family DNA or RNA helicase